MVSKKRNDDHQLLVEIYGWFLEGFDTADLQEAKALAGGVDLKGIEACISQSKSSPTLSEPPWPN